MPSRSASQNLGTPALSSWDRGTGWAGALFLFSFVAAISILKAASNGLFLAHYAAQSLAWMYVGTPFAVGLGLLLVVTPWRGARLVVGTASAALVTGAFFLLLPTRPRVAVAALYLFGEAAATTLSVTFWEELGVLFDGRTAKRVFGPIGAAGMAGSVVGGLFVHVFSVRLGTLALLPFAAGALVCACVASGLLLRRGRARVFQERLAPANDAAIGGGVSRLGGWLVGLKLLVSRPYPMLIAALTITLSILTVAVDYLFRSRAQAALEPDQLTAVFGSVSLVVGLVSLLFQFFLTGFLLLRLDLRGYLVAILGCIAAAAGVGVAGVGFGAIYALKVAETSSSLSLSQPAIQLLYHPLKPANRAVLRGLVDGVLKKLGVALGGVGLLLLLPIAEALTSELGVLVLVAPAMALVLLVHRAYRQLLERRVRLAYQGRGGQELVGDEARRSLEQALHATEPRTVLTALELARRHRGFDLEPHLPHLACHPAAEVRRRALQLSAGSEDRPWLTARSLLASDPAAQQLDELRSVGELLPRQAPAILQRYLASRSFSTRSAALEALYPLEGGDPNGPAHRTLKHMAVWAVAAPTSERLELVDLIGRLGDPEQAPLLLRYLKDPDLSVRRRAILAAGELRDPELLTPLLERLADRSLRRWALQALSRYGDSVVDLCEQMLNDRSRSLEIRLRIPRLLAAIGTRAAARALLFSNIEDDPFLRDRIAAAVARVRRERPEMEFDRGWTVQAIDRRVHSFDSYLHVYTDLLERFEPADLLMRVLCDRLRQNADVILRVLSLLHPPETLAAIRVRWLQGNRHQRADALTLLEQLLAPSVRAPVLAVLEGYASLRDEGRVFCGSSSETPESWADGRMVQAWLLRQRDAAQGESPALRASRVHAAADPDAGEASRAVRGLATGSFERLPRLEVTGSFTSPLATSAAEPPSSDGEEPAWIGRLRELCRSRDPLMQAAAVRTAGALERAERRRVGPLPPVTEGNMATHTLMDRVLFLQSVDLFANQSVDDLIAIAAIATERSFAAGEVVYREQDPSDALHIVLDGEVELTLEGRSIMSVGPGESFGQLSMLDRKPRPVTATARRPVDVISLGRMELFDLISDRSELLQGVVAVLVKRIRLLLHERMISDAAHEELSE